jgi:hypothetical protein
MSIDLKGIKIGNKTAGEWRTEVEDGLKDLEKLKNMLEDAYWQWKEELSPCTPGACCDAIPDPGRPQRD